MQTPPGGRHRHHQRPPSTLPDIRPVQYAAYHSAFNLAHTDPSSLQAAPGSHRPKPPPPLPLLLVPTHHLPLYPFLTPSCSPSSPTPCSCRHPQEAATDTISGLLALRPAGPTPSSRPRVAPAAAPAAGRGAAPTASSASSTTGGGRAWGGGWAGPQQQQLFVRLEMVTVNDLMELGPEGVLQVRPGDCGCV
jgi:hypothetical protein